MLVRHERRQVELPVEQRIARNHDDVAIVVVAAPI